MAEKDIRFNLEIVKTNKKLSDTNVLEYRFINLSDTRAYILNRVLRIKPQVSVTNFANGINFFVNENENDTTIYEISFDDPFDPENEVLVITKVRANYKH